MQYTGELDLSVDVQVFNLDLWDTTPGIIQELRERDIFVMCYFNAGAYEEWRPDASTFVPVVLGKDLAGWPGERWLDIRRIDILGPIMTSRLDLAVEKGCHGVDPDNVNGYTNDTGFALTAEDQLAYNRFLAFAAHERGLAIGLKNDIEQIPELVDDFDWMINESCFRYQECTALLPFKEAGKPVFVIEYDQAPEYICPQSQQMGFNTLIKHRELDAYRIDCHQFVQTKT
ncbi:endo alpha-1,4 polygalactosaminidase [Chloroflexus sp.]|uniref:endo alpha-1,4 polygalactosaminidase n=1 Tax=Chloroflexus sp. TaxID=1904827 RepID=UPI003A102081